VTDKQPTASCSVRPVTVTELHAIGARLRGGTAATGLWRSVIARLGELSDPAVTIRAAGRAGQIALIGVDTPGRTLLVLAVTDDADALALLADAFARQTPPSANGVAGVEPAAAIITACWRERFGIAFAATGRQLILELQTVLAGCAAAGGLRVATPRDLPLIVEWSVAFTAETHAAEDRSTTATLVSRRVATGDVFVWEDPNPVSLLVAFRDPQRAWIDWLYTPPRHRRRGYGGALVADACCRLVAGGRECALFVSEADAATIRLYTRVGFTPVGVFAEYAPTPNPVPGGSDER
jgi:predicted GNAT family acetyltransferase